jgi:hypothetical protein
MREIRTSGSTRGEEGAPQGVTFSPTLPISGTPVNWRILWNERNPPCELPVQHVAERAWGGVIRLAKSREANLRAVTQMNPIRPRYAK